MLLKKNRNLFLLLALTLFVSLILNVSLGQVSIPIKEIFSSICYASSSNETWNYIILNFRIPKAITAILVGTGLSMAGLLMQTLFRNPLAGPDVLGLSSGSSLGAAIILLGASFLPSFLSETFVSSFGIIIASCFGSFVILVLVLIASKKLNDSSTILVVGILFSSFSGAIISVLTYFSTAEELQKFAFWSLGSLGNLTIRNIIILTICISIGLILALFSVKSLDGLLLGENYAKSVGINIKKSRQIIILSTSILVGSSTAFVGPIAFIGLAVPHLAKIIFQTSTHKVLLLGSVLLGANLMLICDTISQMPGFDFTLPINAITSIFGAPMILWLIFNKKR